MAWKRYRSVQEMTEELKTWTPSWGNQVSTRAIIYACQKLDEIAELLRGKPRRRKPSAWNAFFSHGMKSGKSPGQIGKEWRLRK